MTKRSPILFWLLVAATLSVNVVAVYWLLGLQDSAGSWRNVNATEYFRALLLYDALATASVSIVCIYVAFWCRFRIVQWSAIMGAVVLASLPLAWLNVLNFAGMAGYLGGQAILLTVLLWTLRQTGYWRKRLGETEIDRWKFSIFDVLAVTTGAAIVLGLLKYRNLLHMGWLMIFTPAIVGNASLGVAAVAIHASRQSIWIRMAALLAIAAFTGTFLSIFPLVPGRNVGDEIARHLVQAVLLLAWLEIGRITSPDGSDFVEPSTAPTNPECKG